MPSCTPATKTASRPCPAGCTTTTTTVPTPLWEAEAHANPQQRPREPHLEAHSSASWMLRPSVGCLARASSPSGHRCCCRSFPRPWLDSGWRASPRARPTCECRGCLRTAACARPSTSCAPPVATVNHWPNSPGRGDAGSPPCLDTCPRPTVGWLVARGGAAVSDGDRPNIPTGRHGHLPPGVPLHPPHVMSKPRTDPSGPSALEGMSDLEPR